MVIQTHYITFQDINLQPYFKIACVKSVLWPVLNSNVVDVSLSGGSLGYWTACNNFKRHCTLPYCEEGVPTFWNLMWALFCKHRCQSHGALGVGKPIDCPGKSVTYILSECTTCGVYKTTVFIFIFIPVVEHAPTLTVYVTVSPTLKPQDLSKFLVDK